MIRPPAGSTQCKQCRREPMPHSLLCRHQALDPAKSKQRHEICERRHWMEVLQCNENHTFPGTPLSLVLCATAPTILSNQQYGRLLPVDSGHEKLRLHVLDGWKSKTTNFFALRSRDCIHVQAGPTEALCHSRTPSEDKHVCTPTFLGWRKRKMSS